MINRYPFLSKCFRCVFKSRAHHHDHGLIHFVCTDAKCHSLPGNKPVANANCNLQPIPRTGPPMTPAALANNVAALLVVALFKREACMCEFLMNSIAVLKQSFLLGIGHDLSQIVVILFAALSSSFGISNARYFTSYLWNSNGQYYC